MKLVSMLCVVSSLSTFLEISPSYIRSQYTRAHSDSDTKRRAEYRSKGKSVVLVDEWT